KVVTVDQTSGGGKWQLLASDIHFAGGEDGYVRLANNAPGDVVMADAVRFSLLEADPDPAEFFGEPVTHAGASETYVTFETVEPAVAKVEYGTSQLTASETSETTSIAPEHSVRLTDLQPDTTYHFRLHARQGTRTYASNWQTFKT